MLVLTAALILALQDAPNQAEIEKSIKLGADSLLARVGVVLAGDVGIKGPGFEFSPLVLYTLVHSGIPLDHEEMQRLLGRVHAAPLLKTYQAALTAAALAAIDPAKYQDRLAQCAQYLVDYQADNGQWGYGDAYEFPPPAAVKTESRTIASVRIRRLKKLGGPVGDNSNSQYAALGLRACALGGCDLEGATMTKAIDWWEKSQLKSGGWTYDPKGVMDPKAPAYGSMTAGAVSSLIMLKKLKNQGLKDSATINRGFAWLGKNFTVEENPGEPAGLEDWKFYYLYAMERAADLYPTEQIGKQDWYAIGAAHLLKIQRANGTWIAKNSAYVVPDTCFALLFLERVARRAPVATGGGSSEK